MDSQVHDLGRVWDDLIASEASRASTTTSPCCFPLTLRKDPSVRHLPRLRRHLAQISPDLRKALREAICGERAWPFVLFGKEGTGKTAAALCLLDYAGGEYYTPETLSEDFAAAQQGRLERGSCGNQYNVYPEDLWSILERAPLVVLDELGTRGIVSDAQYNLVKRLIDSRHGRPFLALSNHDLPTLETLYDVRITSRLAAGTVFLLNGPDRRLPLPPTRGPVTQGNDHANVRPS